MIISKSFCFIALIFAACSSRQQNNFPKDTLQIVPPDTSRYDNLYPAVIKDLGNKHISRNRNYYMLKRFSDSTVQIIWGNDTINRVYDEPIDFMFVERLQVEWENRDYFILHYFTGSSVWLNIVFPLNKEEKVQEFENGVSFDKKTNLFVSEGFGDTALIVHNLKSRAKQFVIERERPCEAAYNSVCLDDISLNNRMLSYKWTTP